MNYMIRKYILLLIPVILFSCEKSSVKNEYILKYYGDAYEDIGLSVDNTDNGYVITGQLTEIRRDVPNYISSSSKKMAFIRTDLNGNRITKTSLGGRLNSVGSKVITNDNGMIITAGYVIDSVTLQKDIYIVELNSDGETVKEKIYKADGNQYANDIISTSEGYMILGTTDVKRDNATDYMGNAAGKKDILLIRISKALEMITPPQPIGFVGNDEGLVIKQDIDGRLIVVGTTDMSDKPAEGQAGTNVFVLNASTGEISIIGGSRNETASDFEILDNGYLIAGSIGNEGIDQVGHIWKLSRNINADPVEKSVDINGDQTADVTYSVKAMCRYKTNTFLLAGQHGTGLSARMLIFAIDGDGNLVGDWIKKFGGTGTQSVNDVISDSEGNVIAIGRNSYENNSMITFLKFRF